MKSKGLLCFLVIVGTLFAPLCCSSHFEGSPMREEDRSLKSPGQAALVPMFYRRPNSGPEKMLLEIFDVQRETGGTGSEEKKTGDESSEPHVDEETIKKAEKLADQDLLSGLNRILKNNETLRDVLKAENIY